MTQQWLKHRDGARALILPEFKARGRSQTLICFSHLRWNFVFQRPQHLMSRLAADRRVIYWEEPIWIGKDETARLDTELDTEHGVVVATPKLPEGLSAQAQIATLKALLDRLTGEQAGELVRWYYTPMMLPFSRHLDAACTVYDCMDELANFRFAPPELIGLEQELLAMADVVFTGGWSLYEAKKALHRNIHPFPSSVDRAHFAKARGPRWRGTDGCCGAGPSSPRRGSSRQ